MWNTGKGGEQLELWFTLVGTQYGMIASRDWHLLINVDTRPLGLSNDAPIRVPKGSERVCPAKQIYT